MKNKVCLITGAATGLGFEFSKLAIKDGFDLFLIDINHQELKNVKKELSKTYPQQIKIIKKDLSKPNVAEEIYSEIRESRVDMLINNAGFGVYGKFSTTKWALEERMMYLHILNSTHLTKLVLQDMIQRDSGKILNVASLAAFLPGPLMSIYFASKSFLLSFSEAISSELKDTGVSITVLCPGPTRTNFQNTVNNTSTRSRKKLRMANPSTVAKYGYHALKNRQVVAIPGIFNKILAFLPRILPRNIVRRILQKIQSSQRIHPKTIPEFNNKKLNSTLKK